MSSRPFELGRVRIARRNLQDAAVIFIEDPW